MKVKDLRKILDQVPEEYDEFEVLRENEIIEPFACIGSYEYGFFDATAAIDDDDEDLHVERCNALALGDSTGYKINPEDKVEFEA